MRALIVIDRFDDLAVVQMCVNNGDADCVRLLYLGLGVTEPFQDSDDLGPGARIATPVKGN